ncbi:MerR family transcriptional regulator [Thalassococcus sp. S3]|uniref:MerR family transcriptional regulator n=1 Tax=Thalassococcus sp. S3 TaxID=2017482 RepID=UPI001024363F|nr:MerR family transcriptional regulator [Thalassococcus sp. S3]QBF32522.1 MerR family transcriptional regulator [Thalassococcus sp. S3]
MKISEIAERTGLTISAIRYYEMSEICPPIARDPDGTRVFSPTDLDWLLLLSSLRKTGMPTAEMQRFAALYRRGNETVPDRKQMLIAHAERLRERRAELENCADLLRRKLARYDEIIEGAGCA